MQDGQLWAGVRARVGAACTFRMQAGERGGGKGQTLSRGLWDQGSGLRTHLLGPVAQPVFAAVVGPSRRGWAHCCPLPPSQSSERGVCQRVHPGKEPVESDSRVTSTLGFPYCHLHRVPGHPLRDPNQGLATSLSCRTLEPRRPVWETQVCWPPAGLFWLWVAGGVGGSPGSSEGQLGLTSPAKKIFKEGGDGQRCENEG